MEESSSAPSPRELGKANEARLSKLRRVLRETPGFAFLTVTVEAGSMRDEVVRRLGVWSGVDGVPEMRVVSADRGEPLAELAAGAGLVLIEPNASTAMGQVELAQRLNWQRDGLLRAIPGPLVVVVSRAGHQALFEQAPDLYSWRRHSAAIVPQLPRLLMEDLLLPDARHRGERVRLQATLGELSQQGGLPELAQAELRVRISALMVLEGLGRDAEAVLKDSQEVFHRAGDPVGEMLALLGMAEAALVQDDRQRAAQLLAKSVERRQSLGVAGELDESFGRFGTAGLTASLRFAILAARLHLEQEPRQVLSELERVESVRRDGGEKATLLLLQAAALQRIGDPDQAAERLWKAWAFYDEGGDRSGLLTSFAALSSLFRAQGHEREALQVAQRLTDRMASWPVFGRAVADAWIAAMLAVAERVLDRSRDERTLHELRKAEAALVGLPGHGPRNTWMNLVRQRAEIEFELGQFEMADATARSLEELAPPDRRTERGRARLLRAMISLHRGTSEGALDLHRGTSEGALDLLRGAQGDLEDGEDVGALAVVRLGLGLLLLELGRPAEAIEELELSQRALLDLGHLEPAQRSADLLVAAHSALSS
jgi:tetratricopeptide (TPR) repeat protein